MKASREAQKTRRELNNVTATLNHGEYVHRWLNERVLGQDAEIEFAQEHENDSKTSPGDLKYIIYYGRGGFIDKNEGKDAS